MICEDFLSYHPHRPHFSSTRTSVQRRYTSCSVAVKSFDENQMIIVRRCLVESKATWTNFVSRFPKDCRTIDYCQVSTNIPKFSYIKLLRCLVVIFEGIFSGSCCTEAIKPPPSCSCWNGQRKHRRSIIFDAAGMGQAALVGTTTYFWKLPFSGLPVQRPSAWAITRSPSRISETPSSTLMTSTAMSLPRTVGHCWTNSL